MMIYRVDYFSELPDTPQDSTTMCFSTLEKAKSRYDELTLKMNDNFSEEFKDTETDTDIDESDDFYTYTIYNEEYNHFERVSLIEEELDTGKVKMVSKSRAIEILREEKRTAFWPTSEG